MKHFGVDKMQRFNSTLMELNKSEVLRYAGAKKDQGLDPNMVDEACLEARLLAEPKGSWEIYDYDAETHTVKAETPNNSRNRLPRIKHHRLRKTDSYFICPTETNHIRLLRNIPVPIPRTESPTC